MIDLDGTFDIECADWDRFRIAATYDGAEPRIHDTIDSLVDYLLRRGGTWWAHCGGQYDALALAEVFDRRGVSCQIDYPRSRMTRLVAGRLTIRDSFGLLPFSLDVIAAMAGLSPPRLPWRSECTCRLPCGGYCQIGLHPARTLEEYVVADCRVLFAGLCELIDFASAHRIDLRGTIGSTAWATAQRDLNLPDAKLSPTLWRRIRQADKGGRSVLVRPKAPGPGTHRDISSAYPAALASTKLPVGAPRELGGKSALAAFSARHAGVYQCTVDIPPSFLPPLPWRRRGISYPHGVIQGTWPLNEIEAAQARGTRILRVTSAVCWRESRELFGSLIGDWYNTRAKVGKKSPWGRWMRELANSLTGKFGEAPEKRTIRMHPTVEQIGKCYGKGVCRRGCTGACGAWSMLDKWGHMWGQPYYRTAPSSHLQWSCYLKAATRIAWLDEAERHGADHLVSGNTDSIWTTSRQRSVPEGIALGAWETKNTWTDWEARNPSCYRYRDGYTQQVVIRAAGAGTMTDAEWQAGRLDRSRGVDTLLAAAQHGRGLFHRRHTSWTLPGDADQVWYGDRKLGASGMVTWPVDADELRLREQDRLRKVSP